MDENLLPEIPERIKKDLIYATKVFINKRNPVIFVITKNSEIYEIQSKSLVFHLDLKSSPLKVPSLIPRRSDISIISNTESLKSAKSLKNSSIEISVYFYYPAEGKREIFLLSRIDSVLYVVWKQNDGLVLHSVYSNYKNHSFVDPNSDGNVQVSIEFCDDFSDPLITNFLCEPGSHNDVGEGQGLVNFPGIYDALREIRKKTYAQETKLRQIKLDSKKLIKTREEEMKILPAELRSDIVEETTPLIRYGEIFTRAHNDKLVIGVPVLNCTYKR